MTLRTDPVAPIAPRRELRRVVHGEELVDPWAWLRDRDDPQVLEHLRAENRYAAAVMGDTDVLQEQLYQEMVARLAEDDKSVPVAYHGYAYYERRLAGAQYALHCRRSLGEDGEPAGAEEVLLDLNRIAEEHGASFLELGAFRPAPDPRFLAYSLDLDGSEQYELRVLDTATGEHLVDAIPNTAKPVAWGNDGKALYYLTRDHAMRPFRAWRHRLGDPAADDELLWQEDDERFFVDLRKTRSDRWILLSMGSHTTSEVRLLDADRGEGGFEPLTGRTQGVEFEVDHHGSNLFLLTNQDALEFRLLVAPQDDPRPANWHEVVAHDPAVHLAKVHCFRSHLVLHRRVDGLPGLRVYRLTDRPGPGAVDLDSAHDLEFDEVAYDVEPDRNPEFDTDSLRVKYTSPVTPLTIMDVALEGAKRRVRKVDPVHGYDPSEFVAKRLHAVSRDGVEVPVDVVHHRDRVEPGPVLLYGYGSYGHALAAKFHRNMLNLTERGWAFAIAHVRGGSEYGRAWYDAGKLEHKENTFHDFVAAAECLVESGLTTPRQLMIRGGSAGGLLVGAVLNLRPDLCHGAIADVPFVDVVHTMLDPSIPLTIIEYEEWGHPEADAEAFARMHGYAPYENVARTSYPHVLITAGLNDPRVQYWEPAKWAQRLRSRTSGGVKILRVDLDSGHGGASGRYDSLRQEAFRQAFLIAALDTERVAD